MDLAFLRSKLQEAPSGFGFCDVGTWLQDVPQIDQLAIIEPIFFEDLTKKEWLALLALLKARYIKDGPAYNLFEDHFQHYVKQNELEDFYKALYLYNDVSQCLDFSPLNKTLSRLMVSDCRYTKTIVLPASKSLEAVKLEYLPALTELSQIDKLSALRHLTINYCQQVTDYSFIKKLKKLLWLDLSDNEQLSDLNFLLPSSQIVILQLLNTKLLDNPNNIKRLAKLKHLKYLTISGTQAQIAKLRELLPNCVVNAMTAINKLP